MTPPRWAEALLERLLPLRDRQTVTGDLREEYAESVAPRVGRIRADVWYLRQIFSLVRKCVREGGAMANLPLISSLFTLLCSSWLAVMELVLRHSGYGTRFGVAICIGLICVSTILARMLHVGIRGERWLWIGAAVLIGIGVKSFIHNVRAAHFEGFVFIISLVLVAQGLLMLGFMGRGGRGSSFFGL
jgi:hypothetical protein